MRMVLFSIVGVLLLAGCGSGSGSGTAQDSGATSAATTASTSSSAADPTASTASPTSPAPGVPGATKPQLPPPPTSAGPVVAVPAPLLDQIRADAATRARVAPADVQVVLATAQTWNDGSLGCPRPGENYTQAVVDGYQVFVQAGGQTFDYRTSQSGIRLCEK